MLGCRVMEIEGASNKDVVKVLLLWWMAWVVYLGNIPVGLLFSTFLAPVPASPFVSDVCFVCSCRLLLALVARVC
jgi:hypothetical protein